VIYVSSEIQGLYGLIIDSDTCLQWSWVF